MNTEFVFSPRGCWSPAQVERYLRYVVNPSSAPAMLTTLLGGRRSVEECVLRWSATHELQDLLIVGKSKACRIVSACAALKAWLAPYHGCDVVHPGSPPERRKSLSDLQRVIPHGSIHRLRLTYATYRLAKLGSIVATAAELGMIADTYRRHSTGQIPPRIANHILSLTPEVCGRPGWVEKVKAWRAASHS